MKFLKYASIKRNSLEALTESVQEFSDSVEEVMDVNYAVTAIPATGVEYSAIIVYYDEDSMKKLQEFQKEQQMKAIMEQQKAMAEQQKSSEVEAAAQYLNSNTDVSDGESQSAQEVVSE